MARNAIESEFGTRIAIESEFQTSKMADLLSKVNFRHPKWPIDPKRPEMPSKVNFEHPKCPPSAILSKIKKKNSVLI